MTANLEAAVVVSPGNLVFGRVKAGQSVTARSSSGRPGRSNPRDLGGETELSSSKAEDRESSLQKLTITFTAPSQPGPNHAEMLVNTSLKDEPPAKSPPTPRSSPEAGAAISALTTAQGLTYSPLRRGLGPRIGPSRTSASALSAWCPRWPSPLRDAPQPHRSGASHGPDPGPGRGRRELVHDREPLRRGPGAPARPRCSCVARSTTTPGGASPAPGPPPGPTWGTTSGSASWSCPRAG